MGVAGNERRVKVELADDVADSGGGEILNRDNGVFHAVAKELRVEDLEEDDRVDRDRDVVLRDDRLRREIEDLLLERDPHAHMVDEGNLDVEAVVPGGEIRSQALDNGGFSLRNDLHAGDGQDHHDDDEHDEEGEQWHSVSFR